MLIRNPIIYWLLAIQNFWINPQSRIALQFEMLFRCRFWIRLWTVLVQKWHTKLDYIQLNSCNSKWKCFTHTHTHKRGFSKQQHTLTRRTLLCSGKKVWIIWFSFCLIDLFERYAFNCVWSDGKIMKWGSSKLLLSTRTKWKNLLRCNKLIKHVYMSGQMKWKLRTQI